MIMEPEAKNGPEYWKERHQRYRTSDRGKFKFLSVGVFLDPRVLGLSGNAFKVFCYALQQVEFNKKKSSNKGRVKSDTCYLTVAALEDIGISRSNRSRGIKELIKVGLIERIPKADDNNHKPKTYRVLVY